jgi:hypothetical protein
MSLEYSRQLNLPERINEKFGDYQQNWNQESIRKNKLNSSQIGKSTLSKQTLEFAGNILKLYWQDLHKLKILEPFAGNGVGSKIIYKKLSEIYPDLELKSTDIQDLTEFIDNSSHPVEFGLNSVETVEKYKDDGFNVLMMISPPPSSTDNNTGYADYFAIERFSQLESSEFLIFIGELGASDGSEGMYQYLLVDNPFWSLDFRQILSSGTDIFGGKSEKEIFIFKNKNLNLN